MALEGPSRHLAGGGQVPCLSQLSAGAEAVSPPFPSTMKAPAPSSQSSSGA